MSALNVRPGFRVQPDVGRHLRAGAPQRMRLSRAKGWKMPENTVKVDRTTPWGNPFVVGKHGTAAECVYLYTRLAEGLLCMSTDNVSEQERARANMVVARTDLRGRNLACWCALDKPCHADVLLEIANPLDVPANAPMSGAEVRSTKASAPSAG